jgi:DNA-binding NarL/FixJ family response regulator
VISTEQPATDTNQDPVRVQALGLDSEVTASVEAAFQGTGIAGISGPRDVRFAPRSRRVDVLLVPEPARGTDLHEVVGAVPHSHVIVIVERASTAVARRLLEAGAHGVVAADELMRTLAPAVRAVAVGLVCVPQSASDVAVPPALSIRERQVLALMVGGLSNAEIGERLYLTESTIKSHAASAFRRLGVRSRREAVALVLGSDESLRRSVLMSHPTEPPPPDDRRRGSGV